MQGRDYTFLLLDDVPRVPDPDSVHLLGIQVASIVRGGKRGVNCATGLNRS
jgi:hypothetical protein